MKNVLLIGANGFLGKTFWNFMKDEKTDFKLYTSSRSGGETDFQLDISDFATFAQLPKEHIHIVVNCAAKLPDSDFLDNSFLNQLFQANILGAQNICKWISTQQSIESIINCSSLSVVAKPWPAQMTEDAMTYPYGKNVLYGGSKLLKELIFRTTGLNFEKRVVNIRLSSLYGMKMIWGGVLCNFIDKAIKSKEIKLTNGNMIFADFLHINDAARVIYNLLTSGYDGILNCGSGHETSLLKLAVEISEAFNDDVLVSNKDLINEKSRASIDLSRLNKIVDTSKFITLREGIDELIQTYKY